MMPPPDHQRPPERSKPNGRRIGLALAAAVSLVGLALLYWTYPRPLAQTESDLVGKWAMPTGPNPPANAVRSVYEFGPGRRLTVHTAPVGNPAAVSLIAGTWRVADGHVILEAVGPDTRPAGDRFLGRFGLASKLAGTTAPPPRVQGRFRILSRDDHVLRLEDQPGSVLIYERVPE